MSGLNPSAPAGFEPSAPAPAPAPVSVPAPAAPSPFPSPAAAPGGPGGPVVPSRVANAGSGIASRVTTGASSAYRYVTGQGLTTLMIVVVAVGVFAALAYTVYQILSTNLKVVTLLEEPIHAISQPKTISSDKFPSMKNGKEFSLSFWVYVEAQSNTTAMKRVLSIGDSADGLSPLVLMDRATNRMYVGLRTMNTDSALTTKQALEDYQASRQTQDGDGMTTTVNYSNCVIVEVEYVPLGRWVNMVVVLDNDVVTLFLDGDIYSVSPVTRFASNGVVQDPSGSLNVGGTNGVSGYVSNVQIANYAFSVFHARALYRAGPVKRTLSWLLPSNLKLQWPIATVTTDE
eukprot:jgi/Tetstr1/447216/TSEL_034653.t1